MDESSIDPRGSQTTGLTDPSPPALIQYQKSINTILLDSTPLLTNTPPLSTLLSHATTLLSTPSVISEIRDEAARSRIDTLYSPFLTLRTPKPESTKFVRDFARRTGDLSVLSKTDVEVLALAYEVECDLNHGDWRLRRVPGQKRTNGAMPGAEEKPGNKVEIQPEKDDDEHKDAKVKTTLLATTPRAPWASADPEAVVEDVTNTLERTILEEPQAEEDPLPAPRDTESSPLLPPQSSEVGSLEVGEIDESSSGDDSEGWITPSNINKRKAKDAAAANTTAKTSGTMQIATITGDFAMQNVLLQMNLNLLSASTCQRITKLKRTILRCHACFTTTKEMSRQFCERCGKPTLTRVTCSTNANGETKLHLKANMQWNNKGNVFSIPKPTHGTASQKYKGPKHGGGGGKGGWGNELILAEDQKEYTRAQQMQRREKVKDLMDEDYLPGILTGDRNAGGRVRVGAGRTVNSRKR